MKRFLLGTFAGVALGAASFVALAQDEVPFEAQIEARQAFMQIYRFNLGILGSMAKGEVPYDAAQASSAAGNLLAAANMSNGAMWPAGSDAGVDGLEGVTRAKPEIWANMAEVGEKSLAMTEALEAMASSAGDGLSALRGNMGAVGDGCKGCHEPFRTSKD